jgi:glycerate kinase
VSLRSVASQPISLPGWPADVRVLLAPDSFKGTASATEVAAALAEGWREVRPRDQLVTLPLADGGEGTLEVIERAHPGARWCSAPVTGPDSEPVDADWLLLPDATAVVELARSSGLPLMSRLDPLGAHTYGLGQLLAAALDAGARRIVVGLGGSASTDGGTGALAALGARFLDAAGRPLPLGGGALTEVAEVDLRRLRPPPPDGVVCLVDVSSPLLGPAGAAAVFGPQKGATPGAVARLDAGLAKLAAAMGPAGADAAGADAAGADAAGADAAGAGAAGGTAFGLAAAWAAQLVPGAASVATVAGLHTALTEADLVITGEGRFDATSLSGKVVGYVLDAATAAGVPALIAAGQITADPPTGVRAWVALADLAGDPEAARQATVRWLVEAGRALGHGCAQDR